VTVPPEREASAAPAQEAGDGPLVHFSRPWRWVVAGACVAVAVLRIFWDAPVDALSLGLLGAAVLLVFFRIHRIEVGGITASVERRLVKAGRQVESAEVSAESVKPPPAPVVVQPGTGTLEVEGHAPEVVVEAQEAGGRPSQGYGGIVHREPFDLMPPTNPTERLFWSSEKIRIELMVLAGNSGRLPRRAGWHEYGVEELARHLGAKGVIPPALVEVTSVVRDARTEVARGTLRGSALTTADTLALDLLQKLRAVKRQYVRVRDPDVMLYRDQSLSTIYQETGSVMLVTLDERGRVLHTSVFPRLMQYIKGRFVSWEWNMERVFDDEAWYRDPASGQAKLAFSEAATFVGREYPEQWGLEYNLPRWDAGLD